VSVSVCLVFLDDYLLINTEVDFLENSHAVYADTFLFGIALYTAAAISLVAGSRIAKIAAFSSFLPRNTPKMADVSAMLPRTPL
jgi:hypothetical protein